MVEISTPAEMFELGSRIGAELRAGDLILLSGPLGAGKTLLVQGIGSAMGISGITSPTFVIARTHKGALPLIHVDAYRLQQGDNPQLSLDELDLDTQREDAVTIIEWGFDLGARLSEERLEIEIDRSSDTRKVTFSGHGPRWQDFSL